MSSWRSPSPRPLPKPERWSAPPRTTVAPAAASAIIDFDGGAVGTYRASVVPTGDQTPWSGTWRLECADGDILFAGPEYSAQSSIPGVDRKGPGYVELRPRGNTP